MPTNIEIKARVKDFDGLRKRVEELSDTPCVKLDQEDTFFNTPRGRLKLRTFSTGRGELIHYVRGDSATPRRSDYSIAPIPEPALLMAVLEGAWGIRGVVRKKRFLYNVENTRIHLDEVHGLGTFAELEVVLKPNQSEEQGRAIADDLMTRLGLNSADLVDVAYIDLLQERTA